MKNTYFWSKNCDLCKVAEQKMKQQPRNGALSRNPKIMLCIENLKLVTLELLPG